jgi:hypothetical protein
MLRSDNTDAGRAFDVSVDPTDARKPTVRRFGRSDRRALCQIDGSRTSSAGRLSCRAKILARQAGAERSAGIAPARPKVQIVSLYSICVKHGCRWLRYSCRDGALTALLAIWPTSPPDDVQAIMALVRACLPRNLS